MTPVAITVLGLLMVKHFICDFTLQTPWMLAEKGRYGKLGGIVHSAIHVIGTALAILPARPPVPILVTILATEFVVHYHIDWTKEQIVRRFGWKAGARFWNAIGFDQLLHGLTYLAIAAYLFAG